MKIINWNDLISSQDFSHLFSQGSGLCVGSFDGLHKGHRKLLGELISYTRENNLKSVIVTFTNPLPKIKHPSDYKGDISTLELRLKLMENLSIDYVILVEFNQEFSSLSGIEFFNLLKDKINLKFITEGVDFKCGYKGSTDVTALKYFGQNNNIQTSFIEAVYYHDDPQEERISSSFIREKVLKGYLSSVEELLERPYSLEFPISLIQKDKIPISETQQVLPLAAGYNVEVKSIDGLVLQKDFHINITKDFIYLNNLFNFITMDLPSLSTDIIVISF